MLTTLNVTNPTNFDGTKIRAAAAKPTRLRDSAGASHARSPLERGPINIGDRIRGRYVLQQLIGSGGMGQVWKAKDLVSEQARDPNPYVAIKLLNGDFEHDPDAFVSLQRESRKAQELAHPNIITVFAFDIDDDGSHRGFMSMELLEGEPLNVLIARNRKGVARAQALPLIKGMARGLEYAHKKGIVHSDFKPGNVFVLENGTSKVLDFGIARAAKVAGVQRHEDSFDAGTMGGLTVAYASAQMIELEEPHPADDVYALGLVAYELLTGNAPFNRSDAVQARDAGLVPQRIRSLRRYEWRAICRALEFDRNKRWQNASEFLRAVDGRSVYAAVWGFLAGCMALVAGVFWYQNYTAARPSIPLERLPAQTQADFRREMSDADGEWRLVQQGNDEQVLEAVRAYGRAYALHPRDPSAVAGLRKAAEYVLSRTRGLPDPSQRLQALQALDEASDYYADYDPLRSAIKQAVGATEKK